jgi:hypothetical protein
VAAVLPSIPLAHRAFGHPARVTPPDTYVTRYTTAIGHHEVPITTGDELRVTGFRKVFSLRRDHVPAAPQGTVLEVLDGPDVGVYSVDAIELLTAEELRVAVVKL